MESDSKFCVKKAQKISVESFRVRGGRVRGMDLILYSGDLHQEINLSLQEAMDLVNQITEVARYQVRALGTELKSNSVTN